MSKRERGLLDDLLENLRLIPTKIFKLEFEEEVESEAISFVRYCPKDKLLFLTFRKSGIVYEYQNVPLEQFLKIYKAESRGAYINTTFKKQGYKYRKVS